MLLSDRHKFVYSVVPKTGSRSVLFGLRYDHTVVGNANHVGYSIVECPEWSGESQHIPLHEMRRHIPLNKYREYFKFGFVRNPWSRAVSRYCHEQIYDRWASEVDFTDFVGGYAGWIEPQRDFLSGCDFIGRFENLQSDYDFICDKIGIGRNRLTHINKSRYKKHYTEYYDTKTHDIIASKYAKDIEHFGYEFGG